MTTTSLFQRSTEIPCPLCGVWDKHRVGPGSGPHHASLVCASCGSFIRWLAKPHKEKTMYVNECFLAGECARNPEVRFAENGTQSATVALKLIEEKDGKQFATYVPLEAWGKAAEVLAELQQGDPVFIRGKLRWRTWTKDGKKEGRLEVMSWSVQPVATPATIGARN